MSRNSSEYLEIAGHRSLSSVGLGMLNLEREFHPDGAFVRCMRGDDLLFSLRTFLEPAWMPEDRIQARVQVRVVEKLMRWLREYGLVRYPDVASELQRLVVTIYRVKRAQRTEAALRRLEEIRR